MQWTTCGWYWHHVICVEQARREVGAIAKDIQAAQKQVAALEAKIEQKRGERHAILKQCKVSVHLFHRLQLYLLGLAGLKQREFLVAASETSCRNFSPQCSWQFLFFYFLFDFFFPLPPILYGVCSNQASPYICIFSKFLLYSLLSCPSLLLSFLVFGIILIWCKVCAK